MRSNKHQDYTFKSPLQQPDHAKLLGMCPGDAAHAQEDASHLELAG